MKVMCENCGQEWDLDPIGAKNVYICKNCGSSMSLIEKLAGEQTAVEKPADTGETIANDPAASRQTSVLKSVPLKKGSRFGGYQIDKRIGQGGMGQVFEARQLSMNRTVALKIMKKELSHDKEYAQRFIREARSAGSLNHPNIIQIYDVGVRSGVYFMSMEFVEGESLEETLRRRGRLNLEEAVTVVDEVARALEEASANGIIHRDIKPENIMITPRGQIKVADFGLARPIESDEPSLTKTGITVGTPYYMAPEQVQGARDIDSRADIYSLGCTFFHLITGDVPFTGNSTYEVLRNHETADVAFPADLGLPEAIELIIVKMMAKDPADRFENVKALRHTLGNVKNELKHPGPRPRKRKLGKRVLMGILIFFVLLIILSALEDDSSTPSQPIENGPVPENSHHTGGEIPEVSELPVFATLSKPGNILDLALQEFARRIPAFLRGKKSIPDEFYKNIAKDMHVTPAALRRTVGDIQQLHFGLAKDKVIVMLDLPIATLQNLFREGFAGGQGGEQDGREYHSLGKDGIILRGDTFAVIADKPETALAFIEQDYPAKVRSASSEMARSLKVADPLGYGRIDGSILRALPGKRDPLEAAHIEEGIFTIERRPGGLEASLRFRYRDAKETRIFGYKNMPLEILQESRLPSGGKLYLGTFLFPQESFKQIFELKKGTANIFESALLADTARVLKESGIDFACIGMYEWPSPHFTAEIQMAKPSTAMKRLQAAGYKMGEFQLKNSDEPKNPLARHFQLSDNQGNSLFVLVTVARLYISSSSDGIRKAARIPIVSRPGLRGHLRAKPFKWPSFSGKKPFFAVAVTEKEAKSYIRLSTKKDELIISGFIFLHKDKP